MHRCRDDARLSSHCVATQWTREGDHRHHPLGAHHMKDVYFGLALQYDDGVQASVAINGSGTLVEVHKSQANDGLWYHVGASRKMTVDWSGSQHYDSGVTPCCALNSRGQVVEVHKSGSNAGLWF